MGKKIAQFTSRDNVFPIHYKADGTAHIGMNFYYSNPDFLKFLYVMSKYYPAMSVILRLTFPPVWIAWEIWQRKARRSAPIEPNEDIATDARIARLIRAIATAVANDRVPEEVALRGMALNLALLKSMEDGTFHELHSKASRVYAMAEVYHKYLRGEIGDEELIANLGSIQLSVLARAPPPPPPTSQSTEQTTEGANDNNEKREAKHPGEDGVFAKLFASLMFSAVAPKRTEDH
jgi:hypothetical protein